VSEVNFIGEWNSMKIASLSVLLIIVAFGARAETEAFSNRRPLPTPQNTQPDAQQLILDFDALIAQDGVIAQDRAAMANALTSNGNLTDIVRQFFKDRDQAANDNQNLADDRVHLRRDIGFFPTPLFRSPRAQGLSADAAAYIKAFDARAAADAAVNNDIAGMRAGLATSNVAQITSNANAFFNDRHARAQAHADEAAAIGAMRKDLFFKGNSSIHKPGHTGLSDHVSHYLADRQAWLNAGVLVAADRENLRAALNSSSLQAVAMTFLTDHHALFADQKQLSLDRDVMRLDVHYKLARRAQGFFGSLVGQGNSKEDLTSSEDIDQDITADNVGEK
jgi:hypothetical protein